ncbi:MAG: cysteine peptidase family C39 domain-containing protein, partial [Cyanobacteriota bacterium]|nr:cysteine peptidase family C39 domain-containing protein [Cyanobacteriota bacterium]
MTNNQLTNFISRQQLAEILGYTFDHSEFSRCLKQLDHLKPSMGLFWQAEETEAGIYIVLEGKVRLTDRAGELLSTLAPGDSFGECCFFPNESFSFYAARASRRVELAYIRAEFLYSLVRQHPQIQDHLYRRAREFEVKYFGNSPSKAEPIPPVLPTVADDSIEELRDRPQRRPKISKAYFPKPSQKVGHLLQRIVRRYPFYAQQSASDCGATCLVMVARYWGKSFSLNRLRDICNVDRNGASLRGLSAAAESIGFSTRPVKASLDQLALQPLPAIAHWEGKHYIVVYEVTAKQVIVCDPAIGQRTLTHAEFNTDWTNYALL